MKILVVSTYDDIDEDFDPDEFEKIFVVFQDGNMRLGRFSERVESFELKKIGKKLGEKEMKDLYDSIIRKSKGIMTDADYYTHSRWDEDIYKSIIGQAISEITSKYKLKAYSPKTFRGEFQ